MSSSKAAPVSSMTSAMVSFEVIPAEYRVPPMYSMATGVNLLTNILSVRIKSQSLLGTHNLYRLKLDIQRLARGRNGFSPHPNLLTVDAVANATPDNANTQCKRCDSGDEIVRADDHRDDRSRYHDPSDTEAGEDKNSPELIHVVDPADGHCTASCGHEHG